MSVHEQWMHRCIELASKALGAVAPNPMVGAVIIHQNQILGEGFHEQFGQSHAEVNAINSVSDASLLPESELYVSLEPCTHFGKTPPCADLIIQSGIKKVYIGSPDPNPNVSGKGAAKLRSAGIEVQEGICVKQSDELNKRFLTFHKKHRPYIILKWAESADGFIGKTNVSQVKISTEQAQKLTHLWRSQEQSIFVGTETAIIDNPHLNVRLVKGNDPLRLVIDRNLRIPESHHLLDRKQKTFVFTEKSMPSKHHLTYITFDEHQFAQFIPNMLYTLYLHEIQSVLVEGGSKTIQAFLDIGIWDEARMFKSKTKLQSGVPAPVLSLAPNSTEFIDTDLLSIFINHPIH